MVMRWVFVAVLAVVVTACSDGRKSSAPDSPDIAAAKTMIARMLKDPESAQFRDVIAVRSTAYVAVCGEVNAKNSFGGYVGFRPFYAVKGGESAIAPTDDYSARSDFAVLLKVYCTSAD